MSDQAMPPEASAMPHPPAELISRVAGGLDLGPFFSSGRESVRELRRTLAIAGRELESFTSVLDFGCGCGRMLLWLEQVGGERQLHGTDIDADAIAWCNGAHLRRISHRQPRRSAASPRRRQLRSDRQPQRVHAYRRAPPGSLAGGAPAGHAARRHARPQRVVDGLGRKLLLRALRPYSVHEDGIDQAVSDSIGDLTRLAEHQGELLRALTDRLN